MKEIFEKNNCGDYTAHFICQSEKLVVTIKNDGYVAVNDDEAYCQAFDNYSKCSIGGMR